MSVDVSQFAEVFFEEAAEHLAAMEETLVSLDIGHPDPEQLNSIFRNAHSIKGGAGIFGFPEMTEVTHVLESLLDLLRKGRAQLTSAMVDASLAAGDVLGDVLGAYRSGVLLTDAQHAQCASIKEKLQLLCEGSQISASADDDGYGLFNSRDDLIGEAPPPADESFGLFENAPPPIDESFGIFEGANGAPKGPDDAFGSASTPAATQGSNAQNAVLQKPVVDKSEATGTASGKVAAQVEGASIRVSIQKTDQLINLVGELVITEAMIEQLRQEFGIANSERLEQALLQLQRNTRQLQEAAMSLRMLPIGQIFSRFPRMARELARKLDKEITLVLEGETTELDKSLIEKLTDPLTHIVRNSIDHGIETTAERRANGKPEAGTVRLRAFHQGGNIVIEVMDDGRGLNREKILAKAREQGLPVSADMSDAEVWPLIFAPGFSTAEKVTDVSGRGVGMDVVQRNIAAMSGRVNIESWAGHGSRISIRLPLTLAILEGMQVNAADETYVIPLAGIIESLQPEASSISTVGGRGRVVRVRDEYLPLVRLSDIFNLTESHLPASEAIVVLLEAATARYALQVDALVGQSQVVIKSLESNYRRVPGFSGATILGNGRVAMILDIDTLWRMSQEMQPA